MVQANPPFTLTELPQEHVMADPSKRPSVEEVVEQIRELLDDVHDYSGALSDMPLFDALSRLFAEHENAEELLYIFGQPIAAKQIGEMPSTCLPLHPRAEEVRAHIHRIAALAHRGNGAEAERHYAQTRKALVDDVEFEEFIPDSLKSAATLKEFRAALEEQARQSIATYPSMRSTSVERAMLIFCDVEFSQLRRRLFGAAERGSPEWIAQQSWFVKLDQDLLRLNMARIGAISEDVKMLEGPEPAETRWRNFVKREFADPSTIFAMEAANKAYVLMTGKQDKTPSKIATPEKSKRRGRPPLR